MAERQAQTVLRTVAQTLLEHFVTSLTRISSASGRWLTSRGTQCHCRRIVASVVASILGTLPRAAVTFLATMGPIEPSEHHEGTVHVDVLTASSAAFILWHEVGISAVFALTVTAFAIAGGVISSLLALDGSEKNYHGTSSKVVNMYHSCYRLRQSNFGESIILGST